VALSNAGEDVRQQNSHSLLVGLRDSTVILEDSFEVSMKAKQIIMQSRNHILQIFK
jgi:hypothetical protein